MLCFHSFKHNLLSIFCCIVYTNLQALHISPTEPTYKIMVNNSYKLVGRRQYIRKYTIISLRVLCFHMGSDVKRKNVFQRVMLSSKQVNNSTRVIL